MNRTTTAVLVAAALVGTVGGSVTAVVRDPAASAGPPSSTASPSVRSPVSQTPTPSASPSPEPTPSATTPTALPLLYAGDGVIHDGEQEIRYDAPVDFPDRLVRTRDGYLIAYAIVDQKPDRGLRLAAVAPDGTTKPVADVRGWHFDVDAVGTRVVGAERDSGRLTVWDLRGRVQARAAKQKATELQPVFHTASVLFSGRVGDGNDAYWSLWEWDLRTDAVQRREDDARTGMVGLIGSADESLLAGDVGADGSAGNDADGNGCTKVVSVPGAPDVAWRTCDWRRFASDRSFSPDGRRLLAIAADTPVGGESDYGGATFAVFSATEGPSVGLTRIQAPEGTVSATWRGNDRILFLTRRLGSDGGPTNGAVLQECTFDSRCRAVARVDQWLAIGDD